MTVSVRLTHIKPNRGPVTIGEGVNVDTGETVVFSGANQSMTLLACLLAVGCTPTVNVDPASIINQKGST